MVCNPPQESLGHLPRDLGLDRIKCEKTSTRPVGHCPSNVGDRTGIVALRHRQQFARPRGAVKPRKAATPRADGASSAERCRFRLNLAPRQGRRLRSWIFQPDLGHDAKATPRRDQGISRHLRRDRLAGCAEFALARRLSRASGGRIFCPHVSPKRSLENGRLSDKASAIMRMAAKAARSQRGSRCANETSCYPKKQSGRLLLREDTPVTNAVGHRRYISASLAVLLCARDQAAFEGADVRVQNNPDFFFLFRFSP